MAVSGVSSNGLNFTGLATGIDTAKLVDGLTSELNQKRIDRFKTQQSEITTKQTTFAALQGKLFDLQSKTTALARSGGGAFDGRTATTSDDKAVGVAAGTAAVPGIYSLTVNSLAQAAQVASAGFADPNASIKEGTLTLQVGSEAATTVTINSTNNTLQGLADAVNAAGSDLRASVINDGSANPYRVLLTSTKTGSANGVTVTSNLTSGTGAAIFGAGTTTTVQAATDAQVKVGSGAGALVVSSATNKVDNLIAGVSLNLLQADPAKSVTVTVKADTESTIKAVQDFVDAYNGVRDFLTQQTRFDPESKDAGTLLGNRDAAALSDELAAALAATVPGLNAAANRLSSVGLSFTNDRKLSFDSSKLNAALNGQGGAAPAEFKRLFALSGTGGAGVEFVIGGNKTKPTVGAPYQVTVTAPAKRAVVVASGSPGAVMLTPPNNALQIKLNSLTAAGVSLPGGTYNTPEELIAAVQKAINSAPSLAGNLVTAELVGGKVQITTQKYGSAASIAITGGSPEVLTALGFNGTESGTGTDVAGSFLVDGVTETATGAGQVLTGASGNANTDGLQVRSTLTVPGSAGVTVTQGLASRLGQVLNKYLDPVSGRFKAINEGFKQQTTDIDKTIAKQNALLESKTAQLQSRFAAMEAAVNNLKGLQSQLATLVPTSSTK